MNVIVNPYDLYAELCEIRDRASTNKIEAIKQYRESFGVGLIDAKEAVEAMIDSSLPNPNSLWAIVYVRVGKDRFNNETLQDWYVHQRDVVTWEWSHVTNCYVVKRGNTIVADGIQDAKDAATIAIALQSR